MPLIILRYTAGFIDSYDGHTRVTRDAEVEMAVFNGGKAADESPLVEKGCQHHPKQTGK